MINLIKGYSLMGEYIYWTSKEKPIQGSFGLQITKENPKGIVYIYDNKKWKEIK
jgi:hypothetical protein